jgi:hypothetical protein
LTTIETILNSKVGHLNQHLRELEKPKKKVIKARNDCPEVQYIHWQLKYWCEEKGFIVVPELKFDKKRRYRLDFAILNGVTEKQARKFEYGKENMICAIEYQGGIFMKKSGHSNQFGATRDCDKSNLAQSLGWPYFTFTVFNYKNVLQDIEKIIK